MDSKKPLFPVAVIILFSILVLIFIGVVIFGIHYFSSHGLLSSSSASTSTTSTSTTIALEKNPYVNTSLGFQINLPMGWTAQNIDTSNPYIIGIYDPTLKYISQVTITSVPDTELASVDFSNQTVQDNVVKLISTSLTKTYTTTNEITSRVSSTTVKLTFAQSISGTNYNASGYFYFTPKRLYAVFVKIAGSMDDTSYVTALLQSSLATFKIVPIQGITQQTSSEGSQGLSYSGETKTYADSNLGFSIEYPLHWSWTTTTTGGNGTMGDLLVFSLQGDYLSGPTKTAIMSFSADNVGSGKNDIESDIDFIISSYPKTIAVTRNVNILPANIPSDMQAEAVQIDGYVGQADGTQRHVESLYFFGAHGSYKYRFELQTDAADYSTIYPLAVSIIDSLSFK